MDKENYDVLIIGSGAGGGAMAYGLSKRKIRVLVLEAGPAYDPFNDYQLSKQTWEKQGFPEKTDGKKRHSFGQLQELDADRSTLRSWSQVNGRLNTSNRRSVYGYHHVRGVGGSTLAFTGESHRLHPESMKMHSRFGVAADWPITYEELEKYYCGAEDVIGVAGPENQGARWRSKPYPLPPHPLSFASQKIKTGAEKLGISWGANSRAALSEPFDGRPDCNYCGNCNRGCPRTDKGSVDVTFLRKAVASKFCTIKSGISVTRILDSPDDKVRGVNAVDSTGKKHFFPAKKLVLACGAVETARLLLISKSNDSPNGLANESGEVGKNFMETISWSSSGLHPDPIESFRGLPSDSISWDFNAPDSVDGIIGGSRFSSGVCEAGLNGPIAYATRIVGGWGRQHKAKMKATFGRALTVGGIGESLPSAGSFIDLDTDKVDAYGNHPARINSHLDEMETLRLAFMAKTCRNILKHSGVEDLLEEFGTYDHFSSTHVFGTCRMGNNPESSVVDSFGQSHRWGNLTILDASVFPSSGGGESPSLTIEALALRASESL